LEKAGKNNPNPNPVLYVIPRGKNSIQIYALLKGKSLLFLAGIKRKKTGMRPLTVDINSGDHECDLGGCLYGNSPLEVNLFKRQTALWLIAIC
jgi:hypothetical protein